VKSCSVMFLPRKYLMAVGALATLIMLVTVMRQTQGISSLLNLSLGYSLVDGGSNQRHYGFGELAPKATSAHDLKDSGYQSFSSHSATLIEPTLSCSNETFLAVLVTSRPESISTRAVIRDTWGRSLSRLKQQVRVFYVLGRDPARSMEEIRLENRLHGDIAAGDFVDSYRNLSIKTFFALSWVTRRCPQAEFVLKVDDDSVIIPDNFLPFINSLQLSFPEDTPPPPVIYGKLWRKVKVTRDPKSKWYSPFFFKLAVVTATSEA
jgi:Galactosyltransferase